MICQYIFGLKILITTFPVFCVMYHVLLNTLPHESYSLSKKSVYVFLVPKSCVVPSDDGRPSISLLLPSLNPISGRQPTVGCWSPCGGKHMLAPHSLISPPHPPSLVNQQIQLKYELRLSLALPALIAYE